MRRCLLPFTSSIVLAVLTSFIEASVVQGAEPFTWGIGYGEITRDAALTSVKWEFVTEQNQSAAWMISDLPPFDPTPSGLGHELDLIARRGVDPVDFDGFGAALAAPLFRSDLTLDGVLARSDYEDSQSDAWSDIQIDTIELKIHYSRSAAGVWSFWPSLYLSGSARPVPEPSIAAAIAGAVVSILTARRRKGGFSEFASNIRTQTIAKRSLRFSRD
jgi:hypothetical protein